MHAWDPISASIGSTLRIAANPGAHVPARAVIAKVGLGIHAGILPVDRRHDSDAIAVECGSLDILPSRRDMALRLVLCLETDVRNLL
jgi:hypothetical protein